jgi:hypothetical protein
LLVGGSMLGAGWVARNAAHIEERMRERLSLRSASIAIVLVVLAATTVLAAGGHWQPSFVDAETDYLAQIRRLADTGALDDAIGFPRTAGLGGQVALAALADRVDARAAHFVDRGVLVAIAALLVASMIWRRHGVGLGLLLLPVVVIAIPAFPDDPSPRWSLVTLFLGAALALERARARQAEHGALPVVLVLAAMVTLRHAAAIFALAMCFELWRTSRGWPRPPRWIPMVVVASAIVLPYLIAMARAAAAGPLDPGLGSRYLAGASSRILLAVGAGAILAVLFALGTRRSATSARFAMLASCAGIASAGLLVPTLPALWEYLVPAGIAGTLLFCTVALGEPNGVDAADSNGAPAGPSLASAMILATVLAGVIALTRFPLGALGSWPARLGTSIADARALGDATPAMASSVAADYARIQATIPTGARLGIWVTRPDLVDHASHHVVDLRTADGRACQDAERLHRRSKACARLASLLRGLDVSYVLISEDALPVPAALSPGSSADGGSIYAVRVR